jgi:hypothetical protein
MVAAEPSWKNVSATPVALTGAASAFTGPAGAAYTMVDGEASYGVINPNETASCATSVNCYRLLLSNPLARPAPHWDASMTETPSTTDLPKTWTLHVGDSFADVPRSQLFYQRIETVFHVGIAAGCGPGAYCPDASVTRDQMAIFLARAIGDGGANVPVSGNLDGVPYNCVPGGASAFLDVLPTDVACKHIHYIAVQNVTLGCGPMLYCPADLVTRSQMASFVSKGTVAPAGGAGVPVTYGPDPNTGFSYSCNPASPALHFTDVPVTDPFCKHAHYLWALGVVSGCTATEYCGDQNVARGEMAKFLANAFEKLLYGP